MGRERQSAMGVNLPGKYLPKCLFFTIFYKIQRQVHKQEIIFYFILIDVVAILTHKCMS